MISPWSPSLIVRVKPDNFRPSSPIAQRIGVNDRPRARPRIRGAAVWRREFEGVFLGFLGGAQGSLQMGDHRPPQVGEMRQASLPGEKLSAQFLLELLHGPGQGGLRHIALFRGAREIQGMGDGDGIPDLMHFHRP